MLLLLSVQWLLFGTNTVVVGRVDEQNAHGEWTGQGHGGRISPEGLNEG